MMRPIAVLLGFPLFCRHFRFAVCPLRPQSGPFDTPKTLGFNQEPPRQTKPKKGQFMNFSQGHSGTKVRCESCLFSQGKTPEFTKMGKIHELFVLALSLVWFAGATPDSKGISPILVWNYYKTGEKHQRTYGSIFMHVHPPLPVKKCFVAEDGGGRTAQKLRPGNEIRSVCGKSIELEEGQSRANESTYIKKQLT